MSDVDASDSEEQLQKSSRHATARLVPLQVWRGYPEAWKQQKDYEIDVTLCDLNTTPATYSPVPEGDALAALKASVGPNPTMMSIVQITFTKRWADTDGEEMDVEELEKADADVEKMMELVLYG